jgi:hypothetical protein
LGSLGLQFAPQRGDVAIAISRLDDGDPRRGFVRAAKRTADNRLPLQTRV